MSFAALNWACLIRDETVKAGARHVLMILANFADENATCFPPHALLSEITNMSPDTIQRRLKELEEFGLIYVVNRKHSDGRRMSNYYVLLVDDKAREHAIAHGMAGVASRSEDRTEAGLHAATCGMDHAANETEPCRNGDVSMPQLCGIEPSRIHQGTNPPTPQRGEGRGRKPADDDEARLDRWEAFRRVWPWDATELPGDAQRVFLRLSATEQQAAIDAAPKYAAACQERKTSARNHGMAHAAKWLGGEGWLVMKARSVESAAAIGGAPYFAALGTAQFWRWVEHYQATKERRLFPRNRKGEMATPSDEIVLMPLLIEKAGRKGFYCASEWPPRREPGEGARDGPPAPE